MILTNDTMIRDAIVFPKNQRGVDVMFDAPSSVAGEQLNEIGLSLKPKLNGSGQ